ncbi:hypothetical protein D0Z07_1291 [Hyphodiscus hymeniophilus]|uniref:Uncharacterized protein n=1 Tax=Hyphodiscus hymeniophilus TaxID=353542 RepID=A0A9P6VQL4_9HELO|nr:hypothetical protein D0Z07_1291 [Hyphodiscus hymeniophilus]
MGSLLQYSALSAFISSVAGFAIGEIPTQTIGYGAPFMHEPTEAPSMELVKRSLERRDVTNTCTEWTIPGGFGQPLCSNSETCLFTSDVFGNLWEGCGETSISYDWITECWDYPQTGVPPVSQIYCDAAAPSCGFLAFQFDDLDTYYNFGCSTVSYSLYVDLLSTTDASSSQTLTLAAGGTSSLTETAAPTEVTSTPTSVPAVIATGFGEGTATTSAVPTRPDSTTVPVIGSHKTKKKAPIGAIVGGVIGGLAVIALVAFLAWFVLRRRRQDGAATQTQQPQVQQQQPDSANANAFHNNNRISEIAGTMKPMPEHMGAFAPEQQSPANGNEKLMGQQVNEYPTSSPQSPPPVYAQPGLQGQQQQHQSTVSQYPPSNYTELENHNLQPGNSRISVPPVSPVGTYNSNGTDLAGSNTGTYQPSVSPPSTQAYQPPPNVQEMQQPAMPPPAQYQTYQSPSNIQEMSGNGTYQQQPVTQQGYQPPANIQEMSGNAASVRPVRQNDGFDMSGAPMSESFGHHELP